MHPPQNNHETINHKTINHETVKQPVNQGPACRIGNSLHRANSACSWRKQGRPLDALAVLFIGNLAIHITPPASEMPSRIRCVFFGGGHEPPPG
jgi:hypothetical protein